jgi:hypothetical protein
VSGKILLLVGGAILAPTLLQRLAPAGRQANGLAVGDPRVVDPGQVTAVGGLQGDILGVPSQNAANVSAFDRFQFICRELVKTKGAVSATSPGFPNLSADEFLLLSRAFVDAVKRGCEAGAYELSSARALDSLPEALRVLITATGGGAGNSIGVNQPDVFDAMERLVSDQGSLAATNVSGLTQLGDALIEVFISRRIAAESGSIDLVDALRNVSTLANAMDTQGIHFELPGIGDLGNALVDSAVSLPARVGDVVGSALGDLAGSIITSTPVLLLAGGYIVYRAVTK